MQGKPHRSSYANIHFLIHTNLIHILVLKQKSYQAHHHLQYKQHYFTQRQQFVVASLKDNNLSLARAQCADGVVGQEEQGKKEQNGENAQYKIAKCKLHYTKWKMHYTK